MYPRSSQALLKLRRFHSKCKHLLFRKKSFSVGKKRIPCRQLVFKKLEMPIKTILWTNWFGNPQEKSFISNEKGAISA